MEANKLQVFSSSSPAETIANIEDLLTDILLRVLSKKTLTRFKCVSKHWLSLISSPSFCISHTTRYKSLYICTMESLLEEQDIDLPHGYRVHAIKLSDLFSLPTAATPKTINLYPLGSSKSELDSDVLRQVTCMWGDDGSNLPFGMGCGVMGSRIVLSGGFYNDSDGMYHPKPSYVLDTTEPEPMFDLSVIPALTATHEIYNPHLLEINGKLYLLSREVFSVFDPDSEEEEWTYLPRIPFWSDCFYCTVYESKIIASFPELEQTFCYDVAASDGSWEPIPTLLDWDFPRNPLVVDCEDDYFDKLMFVAYYGAILVFGAHLSKDGVPTEYERVARISLPIFSGSFDPPEVIASSGAYLGNGKFCFTFMYASVPACRVPLLVFTFDFTYMSSPPAHSYSSAIDPNIHCTIGSFSVKAPGYHLFEFNYADREESLPVPDTLLCDCIVL